MLYARSVNLDSVDRQTKQGEKPKTKKKKRVALRKQAAEHRQTFIMALANLRRYLKNARKSEKIQSCRK